MQKTSKLILLSAFLLLCFSNLSYGQDNSLLAKVAYENAEAALAARDRDNVMSELDKVDELLGTITPKSQYLRVQAWKMVWEDYNLNENSFNKAIGACRKYLELSKTYNLPEEKLMEVTRLKLKLEEDLVRKLENDKIKESKLARASQFIDSLYQAYNFRPTLTEKEFMMEDPERLKFFRRSVNNSYGESWFFRNNKVSDKWRKNEGLDFISFRSDGKLDQHRHLIFKVNDKNTAKLATSYSAFKARVKSVVPENMYRESKDGYTFYIKVNEKQEIEVGGSPEYNTHRVNEFYIELNIEG